MAHDTSKHSIIVDPVTFEPDQDNSVMDSATFAEQKLVSYVVKKIQDWTYYRDSNYRDKWMEYYRLWRGVYKASDKTRSSERSKLINPALSQAIESTVSEQEEATFGKGNWIDLDDDIMDQDKEGAQQIRDLLLEDLEKEGVPKAISEIYLNGAIYGTGIGKINVGKRFVKRAVPQAVQRITGNRQEIRAEEAEEIFVSLEPIDPMAFVIDPAARTVDEALGCGVTMVKPKHEILTKQQKGLYRDVPIGDFMDKEDVAPLGETKAPTTEGKTRLVEYYGLVPKDLLKEVTKDEDEDYLTEEGVVSLFGEDDDSDEGDLVEAFITIANDSALLKAIKNPYLMGDRPIIAYQHDTVPNRFWGRGIAEKGYNPQKALDAELRARMDAMALAAHPMVAMDATRMPRGMRLAVSPGKNILTNGNPQDILMPFKFQSVDQNTFFQSGDLERMIQMGTGAMDSAAPASINPRNQTASGMSMISSAAIKRTKRTMQNIERSFLIPLINKTMWRQMQYNSDRYPANDYHYIPRSTMGIMAREFEQQQLTNLISTVPPDSPAYWMLLSGIFDNSSIDKKQEMLQLVQQQLQQAMQPPPPPPPDPRIEVEKQKVQLEAQDKQAQRQLDAQRIQVESERIALEKLKAQQAAREFEAEFGLEVQKVDADSTKKQASAILDMAKAEAEELGSNIEKYSSALSQISEKAESTLEDLNQKQSQSVDEQISILSRIDDLSKTQKQIASEVSKLKNVEKEVQVIEKEVKNGLMDKATSTQNYDKEFEQINKSIDALSTTLDKHIKDVKGPKKIVRDGNGKVISVNGKKPKRNSQGLIEEI